jgi:serpin B
MLQQKWSLPMPEHALRTVAPLAALVLAMSCGESDRSDDDPATLPQAVEQSNLTRTTTPSTANVAALGAGTRGFAFSLLQKIAADTPDENVIFSPYSISTALAMAYAGAQGTTAAEMKSALQFTLDPAPLHEAFNAVDLALASRGQGKLGADGTPFRLNVANALWAQRGFPIHRTYLDTLALHYGGALYLQDFAADPEGSRRTINGWVEERTEKLIPELLQAGAIRADTRLVLTNTVYFNASWKAKFTKEGTRERPFTKRDGSRVDAPLMHAELRIPHARGANWEAVALPYASDELSLIAVLPDAGAYDAVEKAASAGWFDDVRAKLAVASVALGFPKLDYKAQTSLAEQLKALGMNVPFTNGADFSGLTSAPIAIDDVIHEAVIKVTEGGTIAAAATAITIRTTSAIVDQRRVIFDRPFLYAIVDQPTGHILFLGRVLDPTK